MKNIAILASGNGSNAQKLIEYFDTNSDINVRVIISNKENAKVLERAKDAGIEAVYINNSTISKDDVLLPMLIDYNIDIVVLAGYLQLIPEQILNHFNRMVVNIHPSLLPKYGGKGMYGANVHQAVYDNGESESGITIHLLSMEYDKGEILLQKSVAISQDMGPQEIGKAVQVLEHKYYPLVVEAMLKGNDTKTL